MSAAELAKQLFSGVKDAVQAVAPGLNAEKIMGDVKAEGSRLATQGAAELAQSLFSGSNAYVPYGAGQQSPNAHDNQKDEGHGR